MFLLFSSALVIIINGWFLSFPVTATLLSEQGWLELSQNVLVSIGFFVFILSALMKEPSYKHKQACILAIMALGIFLREIEIQDYPLPDLLIWFGHGKGRTLLLLTLFSAAMYYYREVFSNIGQTFRQVMKASSTYLYIVGILLLFAGMLFDKEMLLTGNPLLSEWCEEMLEMNGYLFMLLSSLAFYREHLAERKGSRLFAAKKV